MIDRIVAAFSFKNGVYKEVEMDESFTKSAWIIVAISALLSSMGTSASTAGGFGSWLFGSIFSAAVAVGAFALSCYLISWLSKALFNADTNFNELVRTLGLAYVWNAVGFLAIVSAISPALKSVAWLFRTGSSIAGLVAWVIAAKEALDLEWGETALTIVIGWVAQRVIVWLFSLILLALGLGVGAALF